MIKRLLCQVFSVFKADRRLCNLEASAWNKEKEGEEMLRAPPPCFQQHVQVGPDFLSIINLRLFEFTLVPLFKFSCVSFDQTRFHVSAEPSRMEEPSHRRSVVIVDSPAPEETAQERSA